MRINRLLVCAVFVVAVVCTPLTADAGNNGHRRQGRPGRHHKPRSSGNVSEFDQRRIKEKNRTKHVEYVSSDPATAAENWGLPKMSLLGWKSDQGMDVRGRAPQVSQVVVQQHFLPMDNFNNSEFNKDKCSSPAYKKDVKQKFRCEPRETIVHLVHDEGLILSPSAVAVKRCDGMCEVHSKCIPTETTNRTFHIRQFQNNQATCGSIEVVQHVRCKCSCPERSTQCTPMQIYDQEECKCKCPTDISRMCLSNKMTFNEQECNCKCKNIKKCSTGTHFDEQKCSCLRPNATPLG